MTKIFCYAPWNNVDIHPSGKVLPCCKFLDDSYPRQYNIADDSLQEFRQSEMLKEVKQNFLANEWPRGCERCRIEEQAGIPSRRQLDQQRWQHHYDQYDLDSQEILTMGLSLGNTCNLKCLTCGPLASSLWHKEFEEVNKIKIPIKKNFRRDLVSSIIEQAPNLVHLDMGGGEPFLSGTKEQLELLDHYISTGQSKHITLHYTSNCTIWPGENWFDRWQQFANIDMQLSIDGVALQYEYLRYPGKWSEVLSNIELYLDKQHRHQWFMLSVSHTVSAFNVYYIDQFKSWCRSVGLPDPWMGRVHAPLQLRPTVWPNHIKKHIADKLEQSSHDDIRAWVNIINDNDDSDHYQAFLDFMDRHDHYRGMSYRNTFIEMAQFL